MDGASTDEKTLQAAGRREFARHVSGFTLATLASRILGYFRDAGIAALFGGGGLTDAYYAAFRIANFLRRTLGEGALNASFVPVLTQEHLKGKREARDFFSSLWTGLALATLGVVALGIWQARPIVLTLTYGFASDPEKLALTVTLTRLLFPHFFFVTAAAIEQGALYVTRRFFLPALAPTAFSISILAYLGMLWADWLPLHDPRSQMMGLAVAATVGSALQWLVQMPALHKEGLSPTLRSPTAHPGVWQVVALMGPSLVSIATDQVDALVDTVFASFLQEGSITAIYNSSRLMQLPLALFGVSTATVALTHLSEHAGLRQMDRFRQTLGHSLSLTAFVLFPAGAGMIVIAGPLVRLLFLHGAFTPAQAELTTGALCFYSLGLVAYGWTKVLVMAHYALKDARTPVALGAAKVALNVALCLALVGPLEVWGLALAASLSSWVCTGLLLASMARKTGLEPGLGRTVAKAAFASAAIAAACLLLRAVARRWLVHDAVTVLACVALAVPLYYALSVLLDLGERHTILHLLGRGDPEAGPTL